MYFDTHVHLDDPQFAVDQAVVIQRAFQAGVSLMLNVGCRQAWYNENLIKEYDFIYGAVGLHPHEARFFERENEILQTLLTRPRVVAVGEVGLDYHYDFSPRLTQQKVLRQMIGWAREQQLPLIIHCREAYADTLRILREEKAREVGGVFHCYSGSWPGVREVLELGFLVALGGVVTFPKARRAVEVAQKTPLEYLLLETDCPYLTPVPYRGQRNEPAYVLKVAEKIAELRNLPVEEIAQVTRQNGKRLFGIA